MKVQTINLTFADKARNYPIHIGAGALAAAAPMIASLCPRKILPVICDETIAGLHLNALETQMAKFDVETRCLILSPGEAQKSFARLEQVCDFLLGQEMERNDCLAAFGGGVIGDLAGLASALVKRGTHFVQIPTTLLAQVDSSVGGKTAINTKAGKNLIGAFHQPKMVVADLDFLTTLPDRQMRAGYAEILKMAVLSDQTFFEWLDQNVTKLLDRDPIILREAIARSVQGKADIVAQDEREHGIRALLNLGHSFAHALEAEAPGQILHGEAVAAGMGAAFGFSHHLELCAKKDHLQLITHLQKCGLPTSLGTAPGGSYKAEQLLDRMRSDKKNQAGEIRLILNKKIGQSFVCKDFSNAQLQQYMEEDLAS